MMCVILGKYNTPYINELLMRLKVNFFLNPGAHSADKRYSIFKNSSGTDILNPDRALLLKTCSSAVPYEECGPVK
jgi:hypothetical protein